MRPALACLFGVFALLTLQRMQPVEPQPEAASDPPPGPRPSSVLVALGKPPPWGSKRELEMVVSSGRTIVFDPASRGVFVVGSSRDAIVAAITTLSRGVPTTVLVDAESTTYRPLAYGELATAFDAATAAGAEHVVYRNAYEAQIATVAALDRGDLYRALVTVRALALGHVDAGIILDRIDRLVDDRARPSWLWWLRDHDLANAAAAYDLVPTKLASRVELAKLVKRWRRRPPPSQWNPDDVDFDLLRRLEPEAVPAAVAALANGTLPDHFADDALDMWFRRPDTRSLAWAAVQRTAAALVERVGYWNLHDAIERLCEPSSHAEVVAAFAHPATISRPVLEETLAEIDSCVAARARIGDVEATLARVP